MFAGDKLVFMSTGKKHEVLEVGIFHPEETSTGQLYEGQVGYVVCNLKDFEEGEPNLRDRSISIQVMALLISFRPCV